MPEANVNSSLAGLAEFTFPDTTGPGGTYPQSGVTGATVSHLYTFTTASTLTAVPAVTAADRATNLTAATFRLTRDGDPPQAQLAVPRRVYTTSIPLAWGASDESGVARYAVQVRVEGGDWTTWLSGTLATQATYAATDGRWFTFRVVATDNVGNSASVEAKSSLARVTKYYYHAGRRVAQRRGGVVYYLHGDHLGSTSLVTSQTSNVKRQTSNIVARQLFLPYGDTRRQEGTLPTDFGFAGRRGVPGAGLVFMHARYYDARLGRFVSADTVVPNPGNPQDEQIRLRAE